MIAQNWPYILLYILVKIMTFTFLKPEAFLGSTVGWSKKIFYIDQEVSTKSKFGNLKKNLWHRYLTPKWPLFCVLINMKHPVYGLEKLQVVETAQTGWHYLKSSWSLVLSVCSIDLLEPSSDHRGQKQTSFCDWI